MARLIDADSVIGKMNQIISDYDSNGTFPTGFDIADAIDMISDEPSVDARPVVHGEWINVRRFHDDCYKADCSNCLETSIMDWGIPRADYKHCRYCGAKMN